MRTHNAIVFRLWLPGERFPNPNRYQPCGSEWKNMQTRIGSQERRRRRDRGTIRTRSSSSSILENESNLIRSHGTDDDTDDDTDDNEGESGGVTGQRPFTLRAFSRKFFFPAISFIYGSRNSEGTFAVNCFIGNHPAKANEKTTEICGIFLYRIVTDERRCFLFGASQVWDHRGHRRQMIYEQSFNGIVIKR